MFMRKVSVVVTIVSLFALFYQLSPFIGVGDDAILFMFSISPVLVVYMAYVILKYGKPSGKTFDEQFYEDYDVRS